MTRRKSILGVLCLSALALCAFGASNASAYTLHQCEEATGTGTTYTSSTCETAGAGAWQTVPLVGTQPVTATATSNFVLSEVVGGVRFTITCTGLSAPGQEVTNEEAGGEMFVSGTNGTSRFTGCEVTAPAGRGCEVPSTLETVQLKSKTNSIGSTKFEPASGTTFITIPVTGESCPAALKGNKAVTGSATSARETASTQAFTTTSGSALVFGGQNATFTGKYHLTTATGASLGLELP